MKLFKSNKSKSYSSKQKAQPTPTPDPRNERKSLLSVSPSESGILNVSNGKMKSIIPSADLPHALSLNQAQSENKSVDEPAMLRPQSAFDHMPGKDPQDDEPENSFVSAQGISLDKKNSGLNPPGSEIKPLRSQSKDVSGIELGIGKSLTELGPQDVELTEKDPEKSSKLPTMKLDINPFAGGFSEKRKPKELTDAIKFNKEPSSSSRVPLIADFGSPGEMRSPDIAGLSESYPLTGLLESPPLEGGIFPTKSIPVAQDRVESQKLQAERTNRDKKALSVSFVEPKDDSSVILKRAVSDRPVYNKDEADSLSVDVSVKERHGKEKRSFLFRKRKTDGEEKVTVPFKVPVALWILIYIGIIYVGMPFAMFFGGYSYKDDMIMAILNFGLLGFFQGIVQALLLYQLIDLPIKTKIRDIEGKHRGLINPSKYLVVNKVHTLAILIISTGLQMAAGITMHRMDKPVTGTAILVSSLCTTAIKGALWFLLIWIKTPRSLKNEKKILDSELKEIGQIRKDFMDDLKDTRKKMEIRSINQNMVPGGVPQMLTTAYLGIGSNVVSNVDVDARKLLHKVYDFSSEFKRIRLKSMRTFMILILSLAQTLVMIHIIRLIQDTKDVAPALLAVVLLFIVGSIFGLMDLFTTASKPSLNTMKLVSLIVTAASYRFLFMDLTKESKMIGATIIKLVYKILLYFFAALFGEKLLRKFKRDKKENILVELYESLQEREASHIRRPIYVFVKFTILLEVDLFFAVISLYLSAGAKNWLDEPVLNFGIRDEISYNFYLALVLIEMAVHVVFGVLFAVVTNTILKKRAKTITISLWNEFIKTMMQHRWVIIGFKGLLLYILIFTFFNDI